MTENNLELQLEKKCSIETLDSLPDNYVSSAKQSISNVSSGVPEFWQNKYTKEASKNWDKFYKRNGNRFYKDRHWTTREFPELLSLNGKTILEIGCGVGNFILPIMNEFQLAKVYACDFANSAIDILKENELYRNGNDENRLAFVANIVEDNLLETISADSVDIVSSVFVFSALNPDSMKKAIKNIYNILKPGGIILFRDYARYDAAQLRFNSNNKINDNFYVRQDGTFAYYFERDELQSLFHECGFKCQYSDYVLRKTTNHKQQMNLDRIFLQAKFIK
ncbi:methyltransferase-like protein 6-like protein [Rozella allomycis CSF55]|uniref:tRNA N(3)-methylcytidine methyltransferase n=1 Tax=Rozella allomycis (strain CSF55) TaxID=988480 RepID=A0A075APS8_ROZAC|nr:Methyltransferase-like domain-containing protein [Rozella allomycis CSF55]RKP19282.1 methyltransferase-like protein 6-like protein [Rozella allomycis CSF55]|eukprot:EPZ32214.1 Methyltransferase-like domain-containing protein [Rozella allomycis CSF55]